RRAGLAAGPGGGGAARAAPAPALRRRGRGAAGAPPRTPPAAAPAAPEASRPARAEHMGADQAWFGQDGVDLRYAHGDWRTGPAFAWVALRMPVVAGEEPSALQRALAAADFGNGVSAALDWSAWAFINPDLTVYLEREPVGPWVGLD